MPISAQQLAHRRARSDPSEVLVEMLRRTAVGPAIGGRVSPLRVAHEPAPRERLTVASPRCVLAGPPSTPWRAARAPRFSAPRNILRPGYFLGEAGSTRSGLFAGCDEARVRLSSGAPAPRRSRRVRRARDHASDGEALMPQYTSIVTLLVVLFYFFIATRVPLARRRFNVQLPAITGHPDFERVFRVHQNTLEWMPIFLPSLWLCALFLSDAGAAALGLVWIAGRVLYFLG